MTRAVGKHEPTPDTDEQLRRLRDAAGPIGFSPGFTDRVMARRLRPPSTADSMQRVFAWMAPMAAAAALLIAVVSLTHTRGREAPLLDRLLGLPTVTLATAYDIEQDLSDWRARTP